MSGPVLVIESAAPLSRTTLRRVRETPARTSGAFEERRTGEYPVFARPRALGAPDTGDADGGRALLVSALGPGAGDEDLFAAEHADGMDSEQLIGSTPVCAVDVIAFCDSPVDHVVTALLTAAVMDVTGGVVQAELREDQVPVVTGLPGLVTLTAGPLPTAFGTASFLRTWARRPGFRLLKQPDRGPAAPNSGGASARCPGRATVGGAG
ncbi:hypothetical protein GTY54_14740, partial [Streptomyces sp. SID625]|nr:hypothetical protein [Streptomyces sp. SID625]